MPLKRRLKGDKFQYMLLLRGATQLLPQEPEFQPFQYMLLLRGATRFACFHRPKLPVSIHAPLARSNYFVQGSYDAVTVSIHAPLARSNEAGSPSGGSTPSFNTCSSCEEQRPEEFTVPLRRKFQYMLLLRGATQRPAADAVRSRFNTCSSCEEQLQPVRQKIM